jgi:plastocyanin
MNAKLITLILLSGFLALAGCVENIHDTDDTLGDNVPGVTVVYLDNSSFHPESVTIPKGDTVKWINNDTAASVIRGHTFQSPALRRGDSYSFTFNTRGTYTYYLISHPWTRGGVVIVE